MAVLIHIKNSFNSGPLKIFFLTLLFLCWTALVSADVIDSLFRSEDPVIELEAVPYDFDLSGLIDAAYSKPAGVHK